MVFCARKGGKGMYCRVIVDIVHENVAKPFTYLIPDGLSVREGQRVAVPFGPLEKEGIVTEITGNCDCAPEKVRAVIRTLEDYAAVPPELMSLAQEMAAAAHCPMAETLRLMLPAQMRGGRVHIKTVRTVRLAADTAEVSKAIDQDRRKGKRSRLLELLLSGMPMTVRELSESVKDPAEALKKLERDGLVRITEEETLRTPEGAFAEVRDPGYEMTPGQQEALDEILPTLRGKGARFLLHGVTGSGKTEVFIKAVRETLALGKSAVILVPEIALTPQMVAWFRGRFGPVAAVIHSRLSAGERYDEWRRIRRGDARVVIGARSAVFSPVHRLGLIVVDEEHESTYLNDRHPQYDTRDVAASRCKRENATLILASATPSILSFARARRGDYVLLEMPQRVNDRPLPEVEITDMRRELENGNRTVLGGPLRKALKECIERGEQAILLMNRRGYNTFVSCRTCGYVVKCPNCDISMTYHIRPAGVRGNEEEDGQLKCHYCGTEIPPPTVCPECGGHYIRYFGAGTQKVEEEVHKMLPGVPTARMDYDTTGTKDGHGKILETFRSGRARILIGTQMIAKGLDFPQVTLVGVVAADIALHLPDYRSRERAFQLFTQAAGRAGRGKQSGRVILQTYKPQDPVIGFAARQDYRAFFESEFRRRRNGLYPPFTILARLLIESSREEAAAAAADVLEAKVRERLSQHPDWQKKVLTVLKDTPSVKFLKAKFRRHILIKALVSKSTEDFFGSLTELADDGAAGAEVFFEINPTTMI